MKAIRIPVFVLVLLLTLSVCNAVYLTGRCALWEQQLAEAHRAADAGQTADAAAALDRLKGIDEVAYVRFASVYRQFKDINTFMSELNKLLSEK